MWGGNRQRFVHGGGGVAQSFRISFVIIITIHVANSFRNVLAIIADGQL